MRSECDQPVPTTVRVWFTTSANTAMRTDATLSIHNRVLWQALPHLGWEAPSPCLQETTGLARHVSNGFVSLGTDWPVLFRSKSKITCPRSDSRTRNKYRLPYVGSCFWILSLSLSFNVLGLKLCLVVVCFWTLHSSCIYGGPTGTSWSVSPSGIVYQQFYVHLDLEYILQTLWALSAQRLVYGAHVILSSGCLWAQVSLSLYYFGIISSFSPVF